MKTKNTFRTISDFGKLIEVKYNCGRCKKAETTQILEAFIPMVDQKKLLCEKCEKEFSLITNEG